MLRAMSTRILNCEESNPPLLTLTILLYLSSAPQDLCNTQQESSWKQILLMYALLRKIEKFIGCIPVNLSEYQTCQPVRLKILKIQFSELRKAIAQTNFYHLQLGLYLIGTKPSNRYQDRCCWIPIVGSLLFLGFKRASTSLLLLVPVVRRHFFR